MLVLSCALTEDTRHVVDRGAGQGGVLVNVGRGGLVDEPELVRCLREGVISSAGPDVLAELLAMDNIVLSGHRVVLTSESMCSNPRAKRPSGRAKKSDVAG
ncbi:unnamed protein product [Miscanthus lutarioriparius]|uniref:D-isomer specific 2-hydroxyacid dehydrogenase NAD-binding domain-containing protein n=1 Tax=Miscanthus lutarioriparius TaxID=422564 RepID=A0A811SHJ9_9POAL|nr:unnamed protein product [Miscanthus lutarioriparius]